MLSYKKQVTRYDVSAYQIISRACFRRLMLYVEPRVKLKSMKLLLNLSVGAGIEMGPNRINEKNSLVKVIFEFDFLVAYFQCYR